jgi:hypothetical protein
LGATGATHESCPPPYTRDAELRVLRWEDIERGIVHITRAFNRRKPAEVKGTESDAPRRFSVEANLRPLLEVMHEGKGDEDLVISWRASGRWLANLAAGFGRLASVDRRCTRHRRRVTT